MRLTCLKTGQQFEIPWGENVVDPCNCGDKSPLPEVYLTGTFPNERAAERSRARAFRAAGLVKNIGGFAFGIALLGVLFFPLALVGAAIGAYSLTMLRGPVARYSGRRQAMMAVAMGVLIFSVEGSWALNWWQARERQHLMAMQDGAREDLKRLLRAQRLHRASTDAYGSLDSLGFKPAYGQYTLYLSFDDRLGGFRHNEEILDPLPDGFEPTLDMDAFTAVAVANIDDDEYLDVWVLDHRGPPRHVMDDIDDQDLLMPTSPSSVSPSPGDETGTETGIEPGSETGSDTPPAPTPAPRRQPVRATPAPAPTPVAPLPAPKLKPKPKPDPEPAPEPDAEPASEPDAEPDSEPAPVPEPIPDPEPPAPEDGESGAEPTPEPDEESDPEPVPAPDPIPEPIPE